MGPLRGGLVLLVALSLQVAACSTSGTTTTPTPTDTTDTFSGTLFQGGGVTNTFTVTAAGTVTATLNALGPVGATTSLTVGLALGTWNGTACQQVLVTDAASSGTALTGATSAAGTLCVRVFDVGNLTVPTPFEVQVVHP